MADNQYKWKLNVEFAGFDGWVCRLEDTLPLGSEAVSTDYIHKPGDIDYSDLSYLSREIKAGILYYIATGADPKGEQTFEVKIASIILVDRLSNPSFVPEELKPQK